MNFDELTKLRQLAEFALPMPWEAGPAEVPFSCKQAFREAVTPAIVAALIGDAMTMAMRLYGEHPETFAPETREVMARWRPVVEAKLGIKESA